jgi:hypothetical protein
MWTAERILLAHASNGKWLTREASQEYVMIRNFFGWDTNIVVDPLILIAKIWRAHI